MGPLHWVEDRRCNGEGTEGCVQGLDEGRAGLWAEVQFFFIVPVFLPSALGCQQQGIMGLVVFPVRGSRQRCLEVHCFRGEA